MTHQEAIELLLRKIEDVCYADNIRDDVKRQEAIYRLAEAHQKVMREIPYQPKANANDI